MAKRRRAKAAQGQGRAAMHDNGGVTQGQFFGDDEVEVAASMRPGAYARYAPPVALDNTANEPPDNLRAEIAVVRLMLAELLKMPLAPDKRVAVVSDLTAALVRLMRENRSMDGSQADQIDQYIQVISNDPEVGMSAARAAKQGGGTDGSNNR